VKNIYKGAVMCKVCFTVHNKQINIIYSIYKKIVLDRSVFLCGPASVCPLRFLVCEYKCILQIISPFRASSSVLEWLRPWWPSGCGIQRHAFRVALLSCVRAVCPWGHPRSVPIRKQSSAFLLVCSPERDILGGYTPLCHRRLHNVPMPCHSLL